MRTRLTLTTVTLFATAACQVAPTTATDHDVSVATVPQQTRPWEAELLAIAGEYRQWTRVSDKANWAPTLCTVPPMAGVQRSHSDDPSTHGRKLYFLYAKDSPSYLFLDLTKTSSALSDDELRAKNIGQVLVKESWSAVEIPIGEVPELAQRAMGDPLRPAEFRIEGEHAFRTGERRGLFVMFKLDPATPGTDEGWVYGAVTADGRQVSESGRVASCMECHRSAPFHRLFGLAAMSGTP